MITLLNTQYVTPFDREDIYSLATELDDVVDHIEHASELLGTYGVEQSTGTPCSSAASSSPQRRRWPRASAGLKAPRKAEPDARRDQAIEDEADGSCTTRSPRCSIRRIDPLLVIRWKDIYDALEERSTPGDRGQRDREHRRQERVAGRGMETALARRGGRRRALLRLHQRVPRLGNAIATGVSTRALHPRLAVLLAAVLNFAGAFVSFAVAATIASGIVNPAVVTLKVILAGLIGAIAWNLTTWFFGLPSARATPSSAAPWARRSWRTASTPSTAAASWTRC